MRRRWLLTAFLSILVFYFLFFSSRPQSLLTKYPAKSPAGRIHLVKQPERYPVTSYRSLPPEALESIPRIQYDFESHPETPEAQRIRTGRQAAVKEAFLHSWNGYKKYAWGQDEVAPISGTYRSSFGGWGATLVDTMDTLWIMGLKEEFDLCVQAVNNIDFTTNSEEILNVFETTIRYLGGLLAAYDMTDGQYKILLHKAYELGEMLYLAFDTPNRMPVTRWQWQKSALGYPLKSQDTTLVAELGSLTLEFTHLTQLTGDNKFYDAVQRISDVMEKAQNTTKIPGLWPTFIHTKNMKFDINHFTFGGMSDSTYEYLPKQHIMLGGQDRQYQSMYETAIDTAKKHLFFRPMTPNGEDILFSGNAALSEDDTPALEPQGQHLGCFVGGMVGIGAKIFNRPEELSIARRIVDGCVWAYDSMPSGLMPEVFHVIPCQIGVGTATSSKCDWKEDTWYTAIAMRHGEDYETKNLSLVDRGKHYAQQKPILPGFTDQGDNRYILRPEAIESIFIMYRITGDPKLQDIAWKMFQSIDKATRTQYAHAAIYDVRVANPVKSDRMESFWLAETLKYFYLIFSEPTLVNLDEWVFNTEAHPFRRPQKKASLMMGLD